jgi:hypothetical protein
MVSTVFHRGSDDLLSPAFSIASFKLFNNMITKIPASDWVLAQLYTALLLTSADFALK